MAEKLKAKLQEQKDYIAKITNQLAKNSSNSSKPSSTDGYKRPIHNSRVKTGKAQGGQKEYINLLEGWKKEFNNFLKSRKRKYYDDERRLINLLIGREKTRLGINLAQFFE